MHDWPDSDADVMRASVDDPARFEALFERHFETIFRYVGRRLGRQAAEDVSAEVFLQAFEVRDRYDLRYPDARPWLFGIAANVMRRRRRTEERRLRALARQPAEPAARGAAGDPAAAPDDALSRLDSRAARPGLARALARLRADEREVLLLVAWGDLTYDEVARALAIPIGTVRSRLHRARARMSKELGTSSDLGTSSGPGARTGLDRTITTASRPCRPAAKEDMRWTTSI